MTGNINSPDQIARNRKFGLIGCGVSSISLVIIFLAIAIGGGGKGSALEFRSIGKEIFAVVLERGSKAEEITAAVREHCAGKQFCKVLGWVNADLAATAMPMTDREVAGVVFDYSLNRVSGLDRYRFDCNAFTAVPKGQCLGAPDPSSDDTEE